LPKDLKAKKGNVIKEHTLRNEGRVVIQGFINTFAIKLFEPTMTDPTGAPRPFDRQTFIEEDIIREKEFRNEIREE